MSDATKKPRVNAAARLSRRKAKILLALGVITLLTWSRQLFGGDGEKSAPAAAPGIAASASTADPKGKGAAATTKTKTIMNFEQAQERMTLWPAALSRRVIDGPIGDLRPSIWPMNPTEQQPEVARAAEREANERGPAQSNPGLRAAQSFPDTASLDELPVRLRSTVLFGATRYAVIEGVRYAEGDVVEILDGAATGHYVLKSIRVREVILSRGQESWRVTIRDRAKHETEPEEEAD
jgi:hypothetical protein